MKVKHKQAEALACLEQGGVALLPVDTVPGLACRADLPHAVDRLLALKGRPQGKAFSVAFRDVAQVLEYLPHLAGQVSRLRHLLPGPWTLVVDSHPRLANLHAQWHDSVGLRLPGPCPCQELLASLPWPLALSSANVSGEATALQMDALSPVVLQAVDFPWLDPCPLGQESTVVDLRAAKAKVLRPGAGALVLLDSLPEMGA